MTNRKRFGCDKCQYKVEGIDKRFPYCTHKKVRRASIHKFVLCPKKK